jgi:hypothetical protein
VNTRPESYQLKNLNTFTYRFKYFDLDHSLRSFHGDGRARFAMSRDPEVIISPFSESFDLANFANINRQCLADGCQNIATKRCSGCNSAKYCSRECQMTHWPKHKQICQNPTGDSIFVGALPPSWTAASLSAIPPHRDLPLVSFTMILTATKKFLLLQFIAWA